VYRGLQIAVVVPAYDEQRLVATTITSIPPWVDRLLVVDDGSTDETAVRAAQAGADRPGFELLRHPANRGVGAAIATGCCRALELSVDAVVVVGADAQMAPQDMGPLLDPLVEGRADYAKGNRLGWPGVFRTMPLIRWLGNWGLTLLTRPVSGYWRITDSQCGYTAISRAALLLVPWSRLYPRYGYPNDLLAWLNSLQQRVVDVPVRPIYAGEKSGIRVVRIILPLLGLLLRILLRRLRHRPGAVVPATGPAADAPPGSAAPAPEQRLPALQALRDPG